MATFWPQMNWDADLFIGFDTDFLFVLLPVPIYNFYETIAINETEHV